MSTSKNRKLAAILFADIVGYTALMQKDEITANQNLEKFHNTLQEKVSQHQGQVINNYGDGCVCTFDSAVDAMHCAKEAQILFQTEPKVPVRIGLHSGDVFFKDDNVFGDSVNIASRIESLGVAGAVLFSKQIKRHIANQTDFKVQSLGEFDFKNVEKTMAVFGLVNEGLVIPKPSEIQGKLKEKKQPKPKWLIPLAAITALLLGFFFYQNNFGEKQIPDEILNARIAVIPFENKTNDTSLEVLGNLTADCITRNLTNLENTKIIQYDNIQQNLNLLTTAPEQFVKLTGANYLIRGRYYKEGKELIFESRITDPVTKEIIFSMNEIRGTVNTPSKLISELAQRVTGYFALKKSDLIAVFTNAPKYEAFLQFDKGTKLFGKDYDKARVYYEKAIELDSNFLGPYLQIIVSFTNQGKEYIADSLLQIVQKRFPNPSKIDGYWIDFQSHLIYGDMANEFQTVKHSFELDPKSLGVNYQMGQTAIGYNRPQVTVDAFSLLNPKSIQWDGEMRYWWYGVYGAALVRLGRHEEALQLFDHFSAEEILQNFTYVKSLSFVQQNKQDKLNELIEDMENNGFSENQILGRLFKIAYDFGAKGDTNNQMKWGKRLLSRIQNRPESVELPLMQLGNAYFITQDYENMLDAYERAKQKEGETWGYLVNVGFTHAKMGNQKKVKAFIEKYKNLENKYSKGQYKYAQAMIYAGLGNKEEAMRFLNLAFKEGYEFNSWTYNYSYQLASLRGYPPFEEFIKPKG